MAGQERPQDDPRDPYEMHGQDDARQHLVGNCEPEHLSHLYHDDLAPIIRLHQASLRGLISGKMGQMDSINREDLTVRLRTHVQYLAGGIGERNSLRYRSLEEARLYIEQDLSQAGYEIQHDAYEVSGRTYRNVIAERPGSDSKVVVIGAHYDTAPGTPGADDNASGVGVLLELARSLRDFAAAPTLRWIAFTLEEPPYYWTPLMGSRVHARKCRQRMERIVCMISLEMTGYYSDLPGSQWYPLPFMSRFYPDRGNFIALAGNFRRGLWYGELPVACPRPVASPSSGRLSRCCREPHYRTTGRSGRKAIRP